MSIFYESEDPVTQSKRMDHVGMDKHELSPNHSSKYITNRARAVDDAVRDHEAKHPNENRTSYDHQAAEDAAYRHLRKEKKKSVKESTSIFY